MKKSLSQKKQNIMARIYRANKKLEKENRVNTKGLSYTDLKAIERTIKAKIEGQKAGLDIANINILTPKETQELKTLARGRRFDSKDMLVAQANKLLKENKGKIDEFKNQMSRLKGYDFAKNLKYAFYEKSTKSLEKILQRDIEVMTQVIFKKDFFKEVLVETAKQVNQFLKDNKMKEMKFDFNNIDKLIEQLNSVEKQTKKNATIGTPKDFSDSPDVIDYELED